MLLCIILQPEILLFVHLSLKKISHRDASYAREVITGIENYVACYELKTNVFFSDSLLNFHTRLVDMPKYQVTTHLIDTPGMSIFP